MEEYLKSLTDEFISQYKAISNEQLVYQAEVKRMLDEAGPATFPENKPWDSILGLGRAADFLDGDDYRVRFVGPLDEASRLLREALRSLLVDRSPG